MKGLKVLWCVLITLPMITNLWDEEWMAKNWDVLSSISVSIVFQNLVVIVAVIAVFVGLTKVAPFLKWSWFSLFSKKDPETGESVPYKGTNINLIPSNVKYFGLAFLVLLAVNLPRYAHLEEELFREGMISWEQGILMSLLFGLTHCLVGVPIGGGLAISVAGLWFTYQYFVGGVELSTVHHTTYNLILVSVLFLFLTLKHIVELTEKKTQEIA